MWAEAPLLAVARLVVRLVSQDSMSRYALTDPLRSGDRHQCRTENETYSLDDHIGTVPVSIMLGTIRQRPERPPIHP